jgi:hypothetical protein
MTTACHLSEEEEEEEERIATHEQINHMAQQKQKKF